MFENFRQFTLDDLVSFSQTLKIPIEEIENIIGCPPILPNGSEFVVTSFSSAQEEYDNALYNSSEKHVAMNKLRMLAAYRLGEVRTYSGAMLIYDYSPNGSPEKQEALRKAIAFLLSDSAR